MPKRKQKPLTEHRIILNEWRDKFSALMVEKGQITMDTAEEMLNAMTIAVETHLHCTACNRVLPDEDFYYQKVCSARRYKSQLCKECWKIHYQEPLKNK